MRKMFLKVIIVSVCILFYTAIATHQRENDADNSDDDYAVYRRCNHRKTFTEQELEIARQYYINQFASAPIAPKRAPCERIKVRHDFKCLTHEQRILWANTFKQLYLNDSLLNRMTEVHARYWPAWHKTLEAVSSHHIMTNIAERALNDIVPGMTMPYWDVFTESIAPERSLIWDYLGRAGDKKNGYCIRGGNFDDVLLTREQRCIRREWNHDGTIPSWYSPEYFTAFLQNTNFATYLTEAFTLHFKPHLFTGGYNGDMAIKTAPNDPLFYLYHNQQFAAILQHFMQSPETIIPIAYQALGYYDFNNNILTPMDLNTAKSNYFSDKYVVEYYQFGYGEMCSLTDSQIEWALHESSNTRPPLPRAVQRLRESLSPERFAFWFPYFASGNYTALHIDLYEVGNRNRGPHCRQIPRTLNYTETANNRRQLEALKWEVTDISPYILAGEQKQNSFIDELNLSGYCSPYA